MTTQQKFIVAEVTKNWDYHTRVENLLSEKFEQVINVNDKRGYKLKEWKLSSVANAGMLTETIIAIFELKENE